MLSLATNNVAVLLVVETVCLLDTIVFIMFFVSNFILCSLYIYIHIYLQIIITLEVAFPPGCIFTNVLRIYCFNKHPIYHIKDMRKR